MNIVRGLTHDVLDRTPCMKCGKTECKDGPVVLNSRCHTGAGVIASYERGSGTLQLECAVCGKLVCRIAVL